jgi:hypothetical protein
MAKFQVLLKPPLRDKLPNPNPRGNIVREPAAQIGRSRQRKCGFPLDKKLAAALNIRHAIR